MLFSHPHFTNSSVASNLLRYAWIFCADVIVGGEAEISMGGVYLLCGLDTQGNDNSLTYTQVIYQQVNKSNSHQKASEGHLVKSHQFIFKMELNLVPQI